MQAVEPQRKIERFVRDLCILRLEVLTLFKGPNTLRSYPYHHRDQSFQEPCAWGSVVGEGSFELLRAEAECNVIGGLALDYSLNGSVR